jgi:hypothetical protein
MNIKEMLAQTGGLQAMAKELAISETDAAKSRRCSTWMAMATRSTICCG